MLSTGFPRIVGGRAQCPECLPASLTPAQRAFPGREARRVAVVLHWRELSDPVPRKRREHRDSEPVRLTAVHALQPSPPPGAEAFEWLGCC